MGSVRPGQNLTADYVNGMTRDNQQRGTLSQLGQGANTESFDAGGGSTAMAGVKIYSATGFFPCKVAQDGGADASDGFTRATWTYTVTTLDGEPIGKAMSPHKPREYGSAQYQETSRGDKMIGVAYYDANGETQLWDAGEVIKTANPCVGL